VPILRLADGLSLGVTVFDLKICWRLEGQTMPQYLYPGVYVEEVETEAHAIPGVDTSSDSARTKETAPLRRPDFFSGRLLDAATLQREQEYQREKLRRYILAVHGCGIVWGLSVSVDATSDPAASRVIVAPGVAIDNRGEQLALPCGASLAAPKDRDETYVAVRFWEHPCPTSESEAGYPDCGCIEEACLVAVTIQPLLPWIALARLTREAGSWSVDPRFQPPRARAMAFEIRAAVSSN
jgi:hypothetical protein